MAIIIDGKKISTLIKEEIKNQVEEIKSKGGSCLLYTSDAADE